MIVFNVCCSNDHEFEGWFADSASFDEQVEAGAVNCPVCGDSNVRKAPSAPRLGGIRKGREEASARAGARAGSNAAPNAAMGPQGPDGDKLREYTTALHDLKKHIEDNSDYVGDRFPEEARKIHYGEADPRAIHGEATPDEARELNEEGVEFHRIPWPKTDA